MTAPTITLIVAVAENGVIGRDGGLPWRLPEDLKHFKAMTLGKPIVMGRKTWESIGRPLPGRTNLVVTRNRDYEATGCTVVHGLDEALAAAAGEGAREIMIIGGARLYEDTLPRADRVLMTRVHGIVEGDTLFPAMTVEEWEVVALERHEPDDRHAWPYSFLELRRVC